MKIKKSDLTRLIECYINEQMSAPVNTGDGASGSKYPESITADNQKAMYDISSVADRRRLSHPDSEAGLKWPQDFVIFEEQFEQHIANWKLFKREYPKSAFVLQLLDLSGVSGYGDLAESIDAVAVGNPSIFDQVIFGINILSASPIGLVMGLFSGRLGLKVVNGVTTAVQRGEANGLKVLGELMKGSTNFGDLLKPGVIRSFFNNAQVITVLEKTGKEITDETIELCILNFSKFLKFLDSFGFRAFMKVFLVITENFGEEITKIMIQWLASESGQEFIKTSKLARWLFEKAPNEISKYLKSES
jgi:hypothetical protein